MGAVHTGPARTLRRLAGWKVSVAAMSAMTFERDLISECVKSGLAAAKAIGRKLSRQPGRRPKLDGLAPKVLQAVSKGRSNRWIGHDLGISKNTVLDIVKRHRKNP